MAFFKRSSNNGAKKAKKEKKNKRNKRDDSVDIFDFATPQSEIEDDRIPADEPAYEFEPYRGENVPQYVPVPETDPDEPLLYEPIVGEEVSLYEEDAVLEEVETLSDLFSIMTKDPMVKVPDTNDLDFEIKTPEQDIQETATEPVHEEKPQEISEPYVPKKGVVFPFADLSDRNDITWADIRDAKVIYGIRYPASFDVRDADFTGRAIDYSDFSAVRGLKWRQIKDAADITGIIYPADFDIESADFTGKNIRGGDFSEVHGLRWANIAKAKDIAALRYPPTFDIENADFSGKNISGSDFSLVNGLRFSHIKDADDISGIKFPADYDIEDSDFSGFNMNESNFIALPYMTWKSLANAAKVNSIVYPEGTDIEKCSFDGKDIAYSDFTRVKALRWCHIKDAYRIRGIAYPDTFDVGNADFTNVDLRDSNFSRVADLRFEMLKNARDIEGIIYPPSFNIDDANFTDMYIDGSDFSHLETFNFEAVRFAASRDNVTYPSFFTPPEYTMDDIQGALIFKLFETAELLGSKVPRRDRLMQYVAELYPGMEEDTVERLLAYTEKKLNSGSGEKLVTLTGRAGMIGDKLFLVKLCFRILVREMGIEKTKQLLLESCTPLFKRNEREKLVARIDSLSKGKFLSEKELEETGIEPILMSENRKQFEIKLPESKVDTVESLLSEEPVSAAEAEPELSDEQFDDIASIIRAALPESDEETSANASDDISSPVQPEEPEVQLQPAAEDEQVVSAEAAETESVTVQEAAVEAETASSAEEDDMKSPEAADNSEEKEEDSGKSSEEEKAIKTGIMGMLLYIKRNASDEKLNFSELSSAFMELYPGTSLKETSAMAQFSARVLSGADRDLREKLFTFSTKAPRAMKRRLLDYSLEQYKKYMATADDEEDFRGFLYALCDTLFDGEAQFEYVNFLTRSGIPADKSQKKKPAYSVVPLDKNIGKVNLYANENFPYYRTLSMVGYTQFSFESLASKLYIEVADNSLYNDTENLVFRDVDPGLRQFLIIDSNMGYLYVERRTLSDWNIDEGTAWRVAERNMESIKLEPTFKFSTLRTTPFRYIQNNLASYLLFRKKLLKRLCGGRDMLIGVPCREIVYLDTYSYPASKAMLSLLTDYDCRITVDGEEYRHPVTDELFIYRAVDGTIDRVKDEEYVILGDNETRREMIKTAVPKEEELVNVDYMLTPLRTDEVVCMTEQEYAVQEAVYTVLKEYAHMNGTYDYTVAENAVMGIFEEASIKFDTQIPQGERAAEKNPLDEVAQCAKTIASAGKTVKWLIVQAFERLCAREKFETGSAAKIRKTVLEEIYGEKANVIWMSSGASNDFQNRFNATSRIHEHFVENARLTFLDTETEMVMHILTLFFHQYGKRYALGQVRKNMVKILPNVKFNFEQNQSLWLPEPGSDIEIEVQSSGMILRSTEPQTREALLQGLANTIGNRDLSNCEWPLLVFAKLLKNAYIDPVEGLFKYFSTRKDIIPSPSAIKTMLYKDLTKEFIKHSRLPGGIPAAAELTAEAEISSSISSGYQLTENIPDPLEEAPRTPPAAPELALVPAPSNLLKSDLNYILEPSENTISGYLRDTAYTLSSVLRVPEKEFDPQNDMEAEVLSSMLRKTQMLSALRSLAWVVADMLRQQGRDISTAKRNDVENAANYVKSNNRATYRFDELFPALCGTPVNYGLYIPIQQEYVFFAQSQMPDIKVASIFTLQQDLTRLVPVMRVIFDILRLSGGSQQPAAVDVMYDALCAWCAFAATSGRDFMISRGPQSYNLDRIKR